MSINSPGVATGAFPDYELADRVLLTGPAEIRAMADPLRSTLLDLVLERAASVTELAAAVQRPKSTVAHHVKVLVDAGLLRVVRTRRVRAIDERFYGRTARLFQIGAVPLEQVSPPPWSNYLADAAVESDTAYRDDTLWANHRHARISRAQANAFWQRVDEVIQEFSQLPREGDVVYGFVAGLYPTEHPSLPDPRESQDPEGLQNPEDPRDA
ncbi:winged helix-turn-helix transcriptional regulator [Nocardioides sp. KIGAM211]|uniref:Winged helix-turn-helix transcriptional regulator n=1 Tax=Nocardioides luti TaxID=2761101 RepID=A0A7X0RJ50_9ACTN|nr:winged helix-turn-helix domain-containing protein [Nocardioides luti]MBB6629289.1 winged helix-turn-helix transcriptional regulator [Nocardioides luti]